MSAVLLRHTDDGGEIEAVNGRILTSEGLETSAYLSLFGGNERDSGRDADDPQQWWGNRIEPDEQRHQRSETQHLLRSLPATPGNLRRLEDAAKRDLDWMTQTIARAVSTRARIVAPKRTSLDVKILVDNTEFSYSFTDPWQP